MRKIPLAALAHLSLVKKARTSWKRLCSSGAARALSKHCLSLAYLAMRMHLKWETTIWTVNKHQWNSSKKKKHTCSLLPSCLHLEPPLPPVQQWMQWLWVMCSAVSRCGLVWQLLKVAHQSHPMHIPAMVLQTPFIPAAIQTVNKAPRQLEDVHSTAQLHFHPKLKWASICRQSGISRAPLGFPAEWCCFVTCLLQESRTGSPWKASKNKYQNAFVRKSS